MEYESTVTLASKVCEGVTFKIVRMSFGRRIHLMRQVRDLSSKIEYHRAGEKLHEHIESNLLRAEIDELYLRWGLKALSGLQLDGTPADTDSLIVSGPEELCKEITAAIKRECALSEEERKN